MAKIFTQPGDRQLTVPKQLLLGKFNFSLEEKMWIPTSYLLSVCRQKIYGRKIYRIFSSLPHA